MTKVIRLAVALPVLTALCAMEPASASARSRSVLKYGAIGLGAAALYNMGQRSAYAYPQYHYAPAYPAYAYPAPAYYAYPAPPPVVRPVPVHLGHHHCW